MSCVHVSLEANMSDLLLFWIICAIVPLHWVFFVLFCSLCFCKVLFIMLGFIEPDQKVSEHHSDSLSTGSGDSLKMTAIMLCLERFFQVAKCTFSNPWELWWGETEECERPSGGGFLGPPMGHAYTLSHTLHGFLCTFKPERLALPNHSG